MVNRQRLTRAEEDGASADELAVGAMLYRACADAADKTVGMKPGYEIVAPFPVMQNLGHAIELALKSWLKSEGVAYEERKGHDLTTLLKEAKGKSPASFADVDDTPISLLNDLYSLHILRYGGGKSVRKIPHFGPLQKAAETIFDACKVPDPDTFNWGGR